MKIELTDEQTEQCWRLIAFGLAHLRKKKKNGQEFTVSDIPGFKEFALSPHALKMMAERMELSEKQDTAVSADSFEAYLSEAFHLPKPITVYGGEVGKIYLCLTYEPTVKELANLQKRKAITSE